MQACVDWVLIISETQVIKKKRPVWSVFPDYLSVSYDYGVVMICPFGEEGVRHHCLWRSMRHDAASHFSLLLHFAALGIVLGFPFSFYSIAACLLDVFAAVLFYCCMPQRVMADCSSFPWWADRCRAGRCQLSAI